MTVGRHLPVMVLAATVNLSVAIWILAWRTGGGGLAVAEWRLQRRTGGYGVARGREGLAVSFANVCFRSGASQNATARCTGQFGEAVLLRRSGLGCVLLLALLGGCQHVGYEGQGGKQGMARQGSNIMYPVLVIETLQIHCATYSQCGQDALEGHGVTKCRRPPPFPSTQSSLFLQIYLIPNIRHPTRHQTLTLLPGPGQDEVAEILDALCAESVGLGVGGDVLLEDEVLRGVEGVDGPVLGFDCEFGVSYCFPS